MSCFNWCFIGAGTLAHTVAEKILPSGRHKIAAVYTRSLEKGRAFADKYGGTAYDSAGAAMLAPDVDGVYIVTPHPSHYEYVKLALSLGRPVLCEKPFTVTATEAAELFALAKEKEVYLAEAMWTWFSPIAQQVKRWVDDGELGEVSRAEIRFCRESWDYAPRCIDPNLAGGALLDVGVYALAYLYRLFGNPVDIRCTGQLKDGIDQGETVVLTFSDGLRATAEISMFDPSNTESVHLEGSKGRIRYTAFQRANHVELFRKAGGTEVCSGEGGYLNEFDMAAGEIRGGLTESVLVPPSSTVDVMRIMDECRRQMDLVYPFEK